MRFSVLIFLGCVTVRTESDLMRSVGDQTESTAMGLSSTITIFTDLLLSFSVPGTLLCESNLS